MTRAGRSFLLRSLPLALAIFPACAASAPIHSVASSEDPFSGDERLAAKRSIHAVTAPIQDVLADVARQSGVRFFADQDVAADPVTVITHSLPLSEALATLSREFGYSWARTGTGKSASYTLKLSDASRAEQEKLRNQRLSAAADRVIQENDEYFKLAELPEAKRMELAAELPRKLAAETDPARSEQLRNMHAILLDLNDNGPRRNWAPAVRSVLKALPHEEVANILRGGILYFSWPRLPGCREFSAAALRDLQQIGRSEFSLSSGFRGEVVAFRLRFVGVGGRQPYINWHFGIGQRTSQFQATSGYAGSIPSPWALAAGMPVAPSVTDRNDRQKDDVLSSRVSVRLPAAASSNRLDAKSPVHRLGEVLELLDRARPINVVADAFWAANLPGFDAADEPVAAVLDRLSRSTGRSWRKDGEFILIKSQDYALERQTEPPVTVVRRWAEALDRGIFTLEDMADLAALPDAQLTTLQEMGMRGEFPVLYSPLHSGRTHLKLWAELGASQRRKALAEGLPYKELDAGQRLPFVLAATDPSSRQLSNTPADEEQIVGSKLRVATRETQEWRVRGKRNAASWRVERIDSDNQPVPREEALKRLKQLDDSIKLEDVQLMVRVGVTFSYDSDKSALAMTWIDLPPRWTGPNAAVRSGTR